MRSCEKECFMTVRSCEKECFLITKEDDCKCALWMLVLLLKKMTVSTPVKNVAFPELSVLFPSCCSYCISPIINTGTLFCFCKSNFFFACFLFYAVIENFVSQNLQESCQRVFLHRIVLILGCFDLLMTSVSVLIKFWKLSMKHSN